MGSPTETLGMWVAPKSEDDGEGSQELGLVIVGDPEEDRFALATRVPGGWRCGAWFEGRDAAVLAAGVIDRFSTASEFARLGDVSESWGLDTTHPGVEWVISANDDPAVEFLDRLCEDAMVRLWVTPSVDGREFALIDPDADDDDARILANFESEAAAREAVYALDAIVRLT